MTSDTPDRPGRNDDNRTRLSDSDEAGSGRRATHVTASPIEVAPGTQIIGTYEIVQHINTGGMGEVYRGVNIHTDEPVAIKIVLPALAHDRKILSLFQKEATVLSRLAHDAIVRYHVFTIDPGIARPCLVMEFVDGESLADHLEQGPMPEPEVRTLLRRVASGLGAAHRAGVVHRDLSPDNIILPGRLVENAKIIDFGIAKAATAGKGTLIGGQFAGKYGYVAPEQLGLHKGEVTQRADIYSLGLVVAAMARGRVLDMGDNPADAVRTRLSVPDLSDLPPGLQGIVTQMLATDPADRPESMEAVIALLDVPAGQAMPAPGMAGSTTSAPPTPAQPQSMPPQSMPPHPQSAHPQSAPPGSYPPASEPTGYPAATQPPAADAQSLAPASAPPRREPDRTVIADSASIPPPASPPWPQSVPPAPQSMAPQSMPPLSVPPPSAPTAPPVGAETDSPFGAPPPGPARDTPVTPSPPAPARKGRGGAMTVSVVALAAVLGGGAWFAGLIPGTTPPTAPPATPAEPVQPVTPPVTPPEPQPQAPEPEPPAPEPEPPAPEPEPDPQPEPEPPAPEAPDPAPEPAQPDPPAPSPLEVLGEQLTWLRGYDLGAECTHMRITDAAPGQIAIEAWGASAAPYLQMIEAFRAEHDLTPDVGMRLVRSEQCSAVTFAAQRSPRPVPEDAGIAPAQALPVPAIVMDRDVLRPGETLTGHVENLGTHPVWLALVDQNGVLQDISGRLRERSDGRSDFSLSVGQVTDDSDTASRPLVLVALLTDDPLEIVRAIPPGAGLVAEGFWPIIDDERASRGLGMTVGLGFVRLDTD